ncbi:hypothetical protein RZO55_08000 [Clostridium boliviensis]|uniref:Uncharacterized protein n=1 Tax=Clostridium boliviensis TaxID=318465 RepID=A0ABU4GIS4_9CLOT|nr:hypothetical protein [Clostridium boliviensis]MDW2797516.1 hypothetical protein [Clostridium boliviensis]
MYITSEILVKAKDALTSALGVKGGSWAAVGGFFFGILIIAIIDKLILSTENPHEIHTVEEMDENCWKNKIGFINISSIVYVERANLPLW